VRLTCATNLRAAIGERSLAYLVTDNTIDSPGISTLARADKRDSHVVTDSGAVRTLFRAAFVDTESADTKLL
jgi:hypothetical protein